MIDLRPAADRLGKLIEEVPEDGLGRPTPCSEYSVGDLLDHIFGITQAFGGAAVKSTGPTSDMGPLGDASNLDPDWRASLPRRVAELAEAWEDPGAWDGTTRIAGSEAPAAVIGTVVFGELSVHGWDLSAATAIPFEPDPQGVAPLFELVQQTFGSGDDSARGEAFGPPVAVPADAALFDRTLGLLGRDPGWSHRA